MSSCGSLKLNCESFMLMFCIVEGFLLVIIGVEKGFGETSLSISLKVKRVVMCLDWMFTS